MFFSLLKALRSTAEPPPPRAEQPANPEVVAEEEDELNPEDLSPEMRDALFPPASRMVSVIF
jgi:hypothetical protein